MLTLAQIQRMPTNQLINRLIMSDSILKKNYTQVGMGLCVMNFYKKGVAAEMLLIHLEVENRLEKLDILLLISMADSEMTFTIE